MSDNEPQRNTRVVGVRVASPQPTSSTGIEIGAVAKWTSSAAKKSSAVAKWTSSALKKSSAFAKWASSALKKSSALAKWTKVRKPYRRKVVGVKQLQLF